MQKNLPYTHGQNKNFDSPSLRSGEGVRGRGWLLRLSSLILIVALWLLPSIHVQAAGEIVYGEPASGTLDAGQKETYTFQGKTGEKPVITMNAHGGSMLPYVALYDPQGQLIGEDSQSGPKGNALLKGIVLAADGVYTVEAVNKAQDGSGEYTLVVNEESLRVYYDGASPENVTGKEAYTLSQPWDHTNISYSIMNTLDGFNEADVRQVLQAAFQAWANDAPITFSEVQSGQGDINVQFNYIDGTYNILGETCPPYNPCGSGDVILDTGETWALVEPQGYGDVSLLAVATHELGHAIGLLHTDDTNALMYPEYSPYVLQPAEDDIAGLQRLYGAGGAGPVNNPAPLPGFPSSPSGAEGQMQVSGQLDDTHFTHFWDFDVVAGDTVTISMEAVEGDLDSLLVLIDAENHVLAYDDDSGGGKDAQLSNLRFPQAGTFTVAATRYAQAQGYTSGTYTLGIQYDVGEGSASAPPTANNPGVEGNASVKVSAGDLDQRAQLPMLDSILQSPFANSAQPGQQTRQGTVDSTQAYIWNQTWCATDAETLADSLPQIDVQFKVNGEPVDPGLIIQNETVNGNYHCQDYFVILSDWTPGNIRLTSTLSLASPVFDGQAIFPPGDYSYEYQIAAI